MAEKPLVSIIVAVHNAEKYLNDCIESIVAQTYLNWELIIVNDGSSDSSKALIEAKAKLESRIIFIDLKTNHKLVFCLNKAISESKGSLIARMDADDIMYPDRIETQVQFLLDNPDVGILGSDVDIIDSENKMLTKWQFPNTDGELKKLIYKKCPFMHPTVMLRKELIQGVEGPYSSRYPNCEDYDLWIRLHKRTKFYSSTKPAILYRVHSDQITQHKIKKVSTDVCRLITSSVSAGILSPTALLFLWKPLFYVLSPNWLIQYKINRRDQIA